MDADRCCFRKEGFGDGCRAGFRSALSGAHISRDARLDGLRPLRGCSFTRSVQLVSGRDSAVAFQTLLRLEGDELLTGFLGERGQDASDSVATLDLMGFRGELSKLLMHRESYD